MTLAHYILLTVSLAILTVANAAAARFLRRSRRKGLRGYAWRTLGAWCCMSFAVIAAALTLYFTWFIMRPHPAPLQRQVAPGITYRRDVRTQPRPLVIHLVTIDLQTPGLTFLVTPPDPSGGMMLRAQRTSTFARKYQQLVAINGSFFDPHVNRPFFGYPQEGDPVDIKGLCISRGTKYSPWWTTGTFYFPENNRVSVENTAEPLYNAISGASLMLSSGYVLTGRPEFDARTAVGIDRDLRTLYLLVVEGKQPGYSEGVSGHELGEILRGYGAYHGVDYDGGGSSTMVVAGPDGKLEVVNNPTNWGLLWSERPVGNHLGVSLAPQPSHP